MANSRVWTREASEQFFDAVAEHVIAGCVRAGVGHLIVLSIVAPTSWT